MMRALLVALVVLAAITRFAYLDGDPARFAFGRLALPEALHVLLAVLGAGVWIHRRSRGAAALAGVLFGLSALAKLNPILVAGLAGVWLLERLRGRAVARDALIFTGGV